VVSLTCEPRRAYHLDPATTLLASTFRRRGEPLYGYRDGRGELVARAGRLLDHDAGPSPSSAATTCSATARLCSDWCAGFVDPAHLVARLCDWITASVTFPSNMVDRSPPATTDEDLARIATPRARDDGGRGPAEPFHAVLIRLTISRRSCRPRGTCRIDLYRRLGAPTIKIKLAHGSIFVHSTLVLPPPSSAATSWSLTSRLPPYSSVPGGADRASGRPTVAPTTRRMPAAWPPASPSPGCSSASPPGSGNLPQTSRA